VLSKLGHGESDGVIQKRLILWAVPFVLLSARRALVVSDSHESEEYEVKTYFIEKEFAAFVVGSAGQVKLSWLALSGDLLHKNDSEELEHLLDEFFRKRGLRAFRLQA